MALGNIGDECSEPDNSDNAATEKPIVGAGDCKDDSDSLYSTNGRRGGGLEKYLKSCPSTISSIHMPSTFSGVWKSSIDETEPVSPSSLGG